MAFVYKQKHVEDALPAFRVSRLSNPGLYSGLSGSLRNQSHCAKTAGVT